MIRNAFRKKIHLAKDHPVKSIHHPDFYNLKSIEDLQAESKITNTLIRINTPGITQDLIIQQIVESQLEAWLPHNHLSNPISFHYQSRNKLIIGISEILYQRKLHITLPQYPMLADSKATTIQQIIEPTEYTRISPYLK